MKEALLIILLFGSISISAQSLKDALYGGKLKSDSNSVIRKTDDLSTKIDTSTKKAVVSEKAKANVAAKDSSITQKNIVSENINESVDTKENASLIKDNTKAWKTYMDSLIITLKPELSNSKKIKNGTYYIYAEYEIDVDGKVTIGNIISTPENSVLQNQVKEFMIQTAPQLNPVLDSNGKARKVKKRYNFNLTK